VYDFHACNAANNLAEVNLMLMKKIIIIIGLCLYNDCSKFNDIIQYMLTA